tara:strand:- start:915 stop:1139 length:225 start_codon:yes stop_codon:yes gene_type:complete
MLQRTLIIVGILFILIGLFYLLIKDIGFGKLPGDIIVKSGNFSLYFPIITCLIVSVVLSILFIFYLRKSKELFC